MEGRLREVVRRFARDQWVRTHGTPRITVLVGASYARQLWTEWSELMQIAAPLLDGPLPSAIDDGLALLAREPTRCVAILTSPAALAAWSTGRHDRARALVDEGVLVIPDPSPRPAPPALDARSTAEALLFEALEADPSTTGRFELNGTLGIRFGASAAEVDLLARVDRIAVEIDGYFHFTDLEAWRRDRRKDLAMQLYGLVVVRVLAEDVMRDPDVAVLDVKRVLAHRLGESRTP